MAKYTLTLFFMGFLMDVRFIRGGGGGGGVKTALPWLLSEILK